jgi:hypothetical protein
MDYIDGSEPKKKIEIRKLQALTGEHSLTLVFPKQFALELGIAKGDFLKCYIDGCRLIVEKIHSSYQAGQIV